MRKKETRARRIKAYLLLFLVLFISAFLIFSTVGRKEFSTPHKFALEFIGTVQTGVSKVSKHFLGMWQDYIALWGIREENKNLREKLGELQKVNNQYREAAATNIRLKKLLKFKETLPPPTVSAEIIGKDPSLWFKTITVNRGSSDGIRKGMPAVTVEGVVGQIMDTSPNHAKILLAIDANSAIDAIIQKTRVQGIVKGDGKEFDMNYVLKNCDVEKDDQIVTSGFGDVFPKGLRIGTVNNVIKNRRGMFQHITITPAVDFSRLEYVLIIMKETSLAD